jgi:hypothetical protein
VETVIDNVIPNLPAIAGTVRSFAVAVGAFLIGFGLIKLVQSSGKQGQGTGTALMTIFCGGLLVNYPTFLDTLSMTLFNASSEQTLSYSAPAHAGQSYVTFAVYGIMIVGFIACARSVLLLWGASTQADKFGRAVTHGLGGIIAVNIVEFLQVIGATAGGSVQSTISTIFGS